MSNETTKTKYEFKNTGTDAVLGHVWVERGTLGGDNPRLVAAVRTKYSESPHDDIVAFFEWLPYYYRNGYTTIREMKR